MKKSFLLFLSLQLSYVIVFAQTITVKGFVNDAQTHQPIEYASVALFKTSDSAAVSGSVTKANGSFVITKIVPGKYLLKVIFIGYQTFVKADLQLTG